MGKNQKRPGLWERIDLKGRIYGLDRYPEPIQLNFNKKSSIPTMPGVFVSLVVWVLVIIYGIQKFNKWIYRKHPLITEETAQNYFTN
jgi:hypothetical protein